MVRKIVRHAHLAQAASFREDRLLFWQVYTVGLTLAAVGSPTLFGCGSQPAQRQPAADGQGPQAYPQAVSIELGGSVKLELVLVPAGDFLMGSPDSQSDANRDQKPQHRVRITRPFYLGKYLVTQEQWQAVMGNNPSQFRGPKSPVENVSWDDCRQFLDKLNAKSPLGEGKFQLPTEAQWEYACRAGSTTRYFFGVEETSLDDYAWYEENSHGHTHPVGDKRPNAWGLYDMHGNAWEWCQDWYGRNYYAASPAADPVGPVTGTDRVGRGGDWDGAAKHCRSAYRVSFVPAGRSNRVGFRVCQVPPDKTLPTAVAPCTASAARQCQEFWAAGLGQPRETVNSIEMKLVLVPPGEFLMGSGESAAETAALWKKSYGRDDLKPDAFQDEHPQHRVRITRPFYLAARHVTRGQFRTFVADSGYKTEAENGKNPGAWGWNPDKKTFGFNKTYSWRKAGFAQTDEHPVINVSWNDAMAFCRWLGHKEGKTYRLPTEAEWEYACRAGTTTRYSCGDDPQSLTKHGNIADAALKSLFPERKYAVEASDGHAFTSPAGSFQPNAFGLYDMHGSAWQWCSDWYQPGYYAVSPMDDPTGPDSGSDRVLRGGCWERRAG